MYSFIYLRELPRYEQSQGRCGTKVLCLEHLISGFVCALCRIRKRLVLCPL